MNRTPFVARAMNDPGPLASPEVLLLPQPASSASRLTPVSHEVLRFPVVARVCTVVLSAGSRTDLRAAFARTRSAGVVLDALGDDLLDALTLTGQSDG